MRSERALTLVLRIVVNLRKQLGLESLTCLLIKESLRRYPLRRHHVEIVNLIYLTILLVEILARH